VSLAGDDAIRYGRGDPFRRGRGKPLSVFRDEAVRCGGGKPLGVVGEEAIWGKAIWCGEEVSH